MINREDMLELTRRMTPARTSFVRMAGCYTDSGGEYDGSFNIHFLKLSGSEKARNLAIAKKIPFAESNEKLREYRFPETSQGPGSIWQMLMALRECGLKNDALLETFYDILIEGLQIHGAYAIYMFYDRYDIPAKASDKERLGESEEMFPYLICAVCPLVGEYEPGNPICGFLFPAFVDRSGDLERLIFMQSVQRGAIRWPAFLAQRQKIQMRSVKEKIKIDGSNQVLMCLAVKNFPANLHISFAKGSFLDTGAAEVHIYCAIPAPFCVVAPFSCGFCVSLSPPLTTSSTARPTSSTPSPTPRVTSSAASRHHLQGYFYPRYLYRSYRWHSHRCPPSHHLHCRLTASLSYGHRFCYPSVPCRSPCWYCHFRCHSWCCFHRPSSRPVIPPMPASYTLF